MANLSDMITPTNIVTFTGTDTLTNKTLTAPVLNNATGSLNAPVLTNATGSLNAPVLTNATGSLSSPVLTTPNLGTPSALVLTNATGTLTSATFVTPALGTPASGVLTNTTGLPLTTGVTGTLPVANGGIGATTLTANNVVLGNGTSAVQVVAPSTSGNVLTSDGTTWASTAPGGGGFSTSVAITSSTTWSIPAGVSTLKVTVTGGGGGNGGSSGGGSAIKYLDVSAGGTMAITIGAGGAGGNYNGGASSVVYGATTLTGNGGSYNNYAYANTAGGTATGGDINIDGGSGLRGESTYGASSIWGSNANSYTGNPYGAGGTSNSASYKAPAGNGVVYIEY